MDQSARTAAVAAIVFAAACGGSARGPADPGPGAAVASLSGNGQMLKLDADGSDLLATLLDTQTGSAKVAIARVSGGSVTPLSLGATDWSDYDESGLSLLNSSASVSISAGSAWFLGLNGVTQVPLDGSAGRTLFQPAELPQTGGHAFNVMAGFTVDQGLPYLSYEDSFFEPVCAFGRFLADGSWQLIASGSLDNSESCFGGAVVADADSVYWSTTAAVYRYRKADSGVSRVVDLRSRSLHTAPWLLVTTGTAVIWLDETGISSASKTDFTPADDASRLVAFKLTDPTTHSLLVDGDQLYWMTQTQLWRMPVAGGAATLLADRPASSGSFSSLIAVGGQLYFVDALQAHEIGGSSLTVRTVPR